MESLNISKNGSECIPKTKLYEELEFIAFLTGMSIQDLIDADLDKKRRIWALLSFWEFYR
jgi:hypothetical protein